MVSLKKLDNYKEKKMQNIMDLHEGEQGQPCQ